MADLREEWAHYQATGDEDARGRLILHCMPLVKYVVGRIAPGLPACLEREDLIESGIFGLISAIERYDPSREMKFESYAILRIRGAVLDELRAHDFNPRTVRRRVRRADQIRKRLREKYHGTPAQRHLEQILEEAGGGLDFDHDPGRMVSFVSLFDRAPGREEDEALRVIDVLADETAPCPPAVAHLAEAEHFLADAVRALPRYERLVITLYYYDGMMLKDIGRLFNVTESRISQVHNRALRRLRSAMKIFL